MQVIHQKQSAFGMKRQQQQVRKGRPQPVNCDSLDRDNWNTSGLGVQGVGFINNSTSQQLKETSSNQTEARTEKSTKYTVDSTGYLAKYIHDLDDVQVRLSHVNKGIRTSSTRFTSLGYTNEAQSSNIAKHPDLNLNRDSNNDSKTTSRVPSESHQEQSLRKKGSFNQNRSKKTHNSTLNPIEEKRNGSYEQLNKLRRAYSENPGREQQSNKTGVGVKEKTNNRTSPAKKVSPDINQDRGQRAKLQSFSALPPRNRKVIDKKNDNLTSQHTDTQLGNKTDAPTPARINNHSTFKSHDTSPQRSHDLNTFDSLIDKIEEQLRLLKETVGDLFHEKELNGEGRPFADKEQEASAGIGYELTIYETNSSRRPDEHGATKQELQEQITSIKAELEKSNQELGDTRTRLSKMMEQTLTDNNPTIQDLGDINRPTKLGERYAALYDNQWTDAFPDLDHDDERDKEIIRKLLNILQQTMDYCKENSVSQMQKLLSEMYRTDTLEGMPDMTRKQLKDCRKSTAPAAAKNEFKKFWETFKQSETLVDMQKEAIHIEPYVEECFLVCWLMCVQDPPVVIDAITEHGQPFDKDTYQAYIVTGRTVDYIVWPALFLHEGGPLLCKGVAQGIKSPR